MADIASWLLQVADEVGLDVVGVCSATASARATAALGDWIGRGYHGDMEYMARPTRLRRLVSPEAWDRPHRTLLVAAASYDPPPAMATAGAHDGRARIAAYACGPDYHQTLGRQLDALVERLTCRLGPIVLGRSVDTAPILERDAAARAGLGFIGRNTMLIHPRLGSWLLLGEIRLDQPLPMAPAPAIANCGQCHRCLSHCPTGALVAPYVLDSRRCISYLTVEHRGWIPVELRPLMGTWLFGCDVCALVCPYNQRLERRKARPQAHPGGSQGARQRTGRAALIDPLPSLSELMALDDAVLLARYRGSPVRRAGRTGLLRNLCIAAGNWAAPAAVPWLQSRLADPEPIVRGHAGWALGCVGGSEVRPILASALRHEDDDRVRRELTQALDSQPEVGRGAHRTVGS